MSIQGYNCYEKVPRKKNRKKASTKPFIKKKVFMIKRIFFSLIPIFFLLTCFSQDSTNTVINALKAKQLETERKNFSLELTLQRAEQMIDLQNRQLDQSNDLIVLFWTVLGVTLTIFLGIVGYQTFGPMREQKEEINRLELKVKRILDDLEGSINSVVEKKYRETQISNIRIAFQSIVGSGRFQKVGLPILERFKVDGFTKEQVEVVLEAFSGGLPPNNFSHYNINVNKGVDLFFRTILSSGYVLKLQKFAEDFFAEKYTGQLVFYTAFAPLWIEYLAQNISLGSYRSLFNVFKNFPEKLDTPGATFKYSLIRSFLVIAEKNHHSILEQVLNDPNFVSEAQNYSLVETIVKKGGANRDGDFNTGIGKYKNTKFLNTLKEYYSNLPSHGKDEENDE